MKNIYKYLSIFLIFSFLTQAVAKEIKIPQIVKSSIIKQYDGENIDFLSIKYIGNQKYKVIVKTEYGKDKIIINKKGKIFSISEYLEGLDPSGGC